MMSDEYLMKENELCFEQLRFYDDRHSNILKYMFSLTSAVATTQFAVYKFMEGATPGLYACQALLSVVVSAAEIGGGIKYLVDAKGETPDNKIHGTRTSEQTHGMQKRHRKPRQVRLPKHLMRDVRRM